MNAERWREVDRLYHSALEREPGERAAFLVQACSGDEELRREVEELLAQDSSTDDVLERPVVDLLADSTVTQLTAGTLLGPYQIEAKLGAGGMGEVFRAKDTRLHRIVAIKILPRDKTADPVRKRRFMQEARAASALKHPNIVTLHDIASDSGADYLVMEYVSGKSLDKLITPRGLPLAEVTGYALQIASALAAAHAAGIVHRDIKPANVIVTADSQVKVLDFGLAKLVEHGPSAEGEAVAQESALTETGTVMGTVGYMSPEQASARPLDHRTDIFSLGVVLYEMLAGRRPFRGKSQVEMMHAIINDPAPPLTQQPPELNEIFDKALAKDPKDRYHHAGDFELDLRRVRSGWQTKSLPSMGAATAPPAPKSITLSMIAVGVSVGLAAGWWIGLHAPSEPSLRADASLINLAGYTGTERSGAISPDGKFFAFVSDRGGQPDIWVRQVSGGDPVQATHDLAPKLDLVYARDGESMYYSTAGARRSIWRVGFLGGMPRKIVEDSRYPAPSPDGKRLAYVSRGDVINIANADGTGARQIASVRGVQYPQWSPDGRWLAYTAGGLFDTYQINIVDAEGKHQKRLTSFPAGTIFCIAWLPSSRDIVFGYSARPSPDSADLLSVSMDGGEVRRLTLIPKGAFTSCSVSADGKRLVGTTEDQDWEIWKAPLRGDPKSNGEAAVRLLDHAWEPMWTQIPRAGMLLFNSPATGLRNLWIKPLVDTDAPRQITFLPSGNISHAALSPDGARVAYVSVESGNGQIWVANSDGSGVRQLTNNMATNFWPFWSPDGQWVAFTSMRPGPADIWKVSASGGTPVQMTHSGGFRGDWSPDGSHIAYDIQVLQGSVREGDNEVALEIAEASTGMVLRKVSGAGLTSPVWSPDGKRLSATSGNSVWMIDPGTGERRLAVEFPKNFVALFRAAWAPDGKSVIVNRRERLSHIVLLENF
jgi:serine/threonine protein kinase/Tol biopolymer transport system component